MSGYRKHFTKVRGKSSELQCTICKSSFLYVNSHQHSSSLRNHIQSKHRQLIEKESTSSKQTLLQNHFTPEKSLFGLPSLPAMERQAIAACCSSHTLPLNIVEDNFFQWAYPCSVTSGESIAEKISELATNWRENIKKNLEGQLLTIILAAWTDSINGKHHVCFLLWSGEKLYYWQSKVFASKTAILVFNELSIIREEIHGNGGRIIAGVADNTRNMQSALQMLSSNFPGILPIPCAVQLFNLMIADVFRNVPIAELSLALLEKFANSKLLPRYSAVRWNSRYESLQKAIEFKLGLDEDQGALLQTVHILHELAQGLNKIQADSSTVVTVFKALKTVLISWKSNPTLAPETRTILLDIFHRRSRMFTESPIGHVTSYLKHFLMEPEDRSFLPEPHLPTVQNWCAHVLPDNKLSAYQSEEKSLRNSIILELPFNVEKYPILNTLASLILKVVISEAGVERVFSKHKLFHTNLRSSLSTSRMDDQLFIRYNFQNIHNAPDIITLDDLYSDAGKRRVALNSDED